MVIGIVILVAVSAIAILAKLRSRSKAAELGWMSERWLAEYRVSRSS